MIEKCLFFLVLCCFSLSAPAQTYATRSGTISFYSDAPMEKIESHNQQVVSKLNPSTGSLDFAVLINAFQFDKQLMHKHFNSDYLESKRYPKATFQGTITNIQAIDFSKDGKYQVWVEGKLNLHGVEQAISEKGSLIIQQGQIQASSKFTLSLTDFNVKVPVILKDKIAKTIQIEVKVNFSPG